MQRAEAEGVLLPGRFPGAEACFEPAHPLHPHEDQLERFLRSELPRYEAVPIVRHLLAGCTRCLAVTRRLWALGERAPLDAESDL